MDTSKLYSMKALLDSRAIGSFIDRGFICSNGLNTWTISCPISVFNIDSFPNKAGEISEVVDVLLQYGTHLERMLLTISDLRKQDLILGYNWPKDRNPKIDWKTSKIKIICYPLCYKGSHAPYKEQN